MNWNLQKLKEYGFNDGEIQRLIDHENQLSPDSIQYFKDMGFIDSPQVQQALPENVSVVPRNRNEAIPQVQEPAPQQPQAQPVMDTTGIPSNLLRPVGLGDEPPSGNTSTSASTDSVSADSGEKIFTEDDANTMIQASPEMADVYKSWVGLPYSKIDQKAVNAAGVSLGIPAAVIGGGLTGGAMAPTAETGLVPAASAAVAPYVQNVTRMARSAPEVLQQLGQSVYKTLNPATGGVMSNGKDMWFLP